MRDETLHQALLYVAILAIVAIVAPIAALRTKAAAPKRPIDAAQVISRDRSRHRLSQARADCHADPGANSPATMAALPRSARWRSSTPASPSTIRTSASASTYLRGMELDKTYTVSLQTMVLCAAEPKKDMLIIRRNVQWLEDAPDQRRPTKRRWSYPGPGRRQQQFAVCRAGAVRRPATLASTSAARLGRLPPHYWRQTQNDDGSWGYVPGDAGTGSMTCAGIGGLAISTAALESGDATVENGHVICCRPHEDDDKLDRAIDWLGRRISRSPTTRAQPAAAKRASTTISMASSGLAGSPLIASSATTIGIAKAPSY